MSTQSTGLFARLAQGSLVKQILVGLVLGILLVMGAYRIFSFLCEHAALDARTFLLGASCLLLAVVGFLLARRSFRRLQYLRDNGE